MYNRSPLVCLLFIDWIFLMVFILRENRSSYTQKEAGGATSGCDPC